jgi:mercuric ion transport protein
MTSQAQNPIRVAATLACLAGGYGLGYRSPKMACSDGKACARPLSNRIVTTGLILATILVVGALAFDVVASLIL